MNIHPLFVHFPIAFLSVYAVLELVHFKKVQNLHGFFYLKSFLVIVGTIAAYLTAVTGVVAGATLRDSSLIPIMIAHSFWATLTVIFFSVLAFAYLVTIIRSRLMSTSLMTWIAMRGWSQKTWLFLDFIARIVRTPVVCVALALLGLVSITVTGALGASIVYGSNVDPFVSFVYHLLIK